MANPKVAFSLQAAACLLTGGFTARQTEVSKNFFAYYFVSHITYKGAPYYVMSMTTGTSDQSTELAKVDIGLNNDSSMSGWSKLTGNTAQASVAGVQYDYFLYSMVGPVGTLGLKKFSRQLLNRIQDPGAL